MNGAKKILKNQGNKTKTRSARTEVTFLEKNRVLLIIGVLVMAALVAVVCYINLRPREILIVEGKNKDGSTTASTIYLKEAMYDIYTSEQQYNSMAGLYEQIYGSSFWTAENVDNKGNNGAQAVKKEIMQNMKQREILYMDAQKNGMSLSDEEKSKVEEDLKTFRKGLSDKQKEMYGLDEDTVRTVLEKKALADKYKNKIITDLAIDENAVKASVSKTDYRQYDLQYYTYAKVIEDDEGNSSKKNDKDLKEAKKNMEALQKKAAGAKDFTKGLITDTDNNNEDDKTGISYSTEELLGSDKEFASDKVLKAIKKMKNGEVSGVLEDDKAYYIVRMENNNNPKAYQDQCTQAVENEKQTQFDTKYKNDIKSNYTAKAQSYWTGRVNIGYLTYDEEAGSQEQEQEDSASGSAASGTATSGAAAE